MSPNTFIATSFGCTPSGSVPRTVIVGLPDTALYEARDRCKAAVTSLGRVWPNQQVTINLTPATLPKAGSHFDLAIVVAALAADGLVPLAALERMLLVGELGLDGRVRPVRGILPLLVAAERARDEASVAELIEDTGLEASHLSQHLAVLRRHHLVVAERRASQVFYRLAYPQVADLLRVARGLLVEVLQTTQDQLVGTTELPDLAAGPRR